MSKIDIEHIRAETPGIHHSTHLLASGSALMPQKVVDAVINHTLLESKMGGYEAHENQSKMLDGVYDSVARLISAKPHEIALMENATVAWCHAFYALPLKPKTRILTCEAEYAANYVAFLQRAKRDDLTIDVIPSGPDGALDISALEAMMADDVSLIAITWVPTNGGLVNPAAAVGKIANKHGVPYLLDACQAVGQMPVDVSTLGCDFLSATGRKFLRGPRGTGFLYVREKWLQTLEPAMIDHFGAPWVSRDQYQLRDDARRFETWENSYALRAGLGVAIDYALEIGLSQIETRVSQLSAYCRALLSQIDGLKLQDIGSHQCGIISFTIEGVNARSMVAKLQESGFIIGASAADSTRLDAERRQLPTLLRMAPHYYNTKKEISDCIEALAKFSPAKSSP